MSNPLASPVFDTIAAPPPAPGSNRFFGLFFAAGLGILGAYLAWRSRPLGWAFMAGAVALAAVAMWAPAALERPNRMWHAIGLRLARIINPVVLAIFYVVVIVPIALAMRVLGKRPLALAFDQAATTYWVERKGGAPAPRSMRDQF